MPSRLAEGSENHENKGDPISVFIESITALLVQCMCKLCRIRGRAGTFAMEPCRHVTDKVAPVFRLYESHETEPTVSLVARFAC